MLYRTSDGEMLDAICHKNYGSEQHVPAVLEANHGLADLGPLFSAGVYIELPEISVVPESEQVKLWD